MSRGHQCQPVQGLFQCKFAGQPFAPITIPKGGGVADLVARMGKSDMDDLIKQRIPGPQVRENQLADMPDFNDRNKLRSRIAEVHNGSALFTGDVSQCARNIRRRLMENDWLEAIVALPLNLAFRGLKGEIKHGGGTNSKLRTVIQNPGWCRALRHFTYDAFHYAVGHIN